MEIEGFLQSLENIRYYNEFFFRGFVGMKLTDIIITGAGSPAATECLTRKIYFSHYDLVINAGICGSFRKEYDPGTVVCIDREIWGDLGAEDHKDFLDLFDLGILKKSEKNFTGIELVNTGNSYSRYFSHLPIVKGITVSKAHGDAESIRKCMQKYDPDVESMEGAAVFQVCLSSGLNFQCLRSISNFVESRNKKAWDIGKATQNLSVELNRIISAI